MLPIPCETESIVIKVAPAALLKVAVSVLVVTLVEPGAAVGDQLDPVDQLPVVLEPQDALAARTFADNAAMAAKRTVLARSVARTEVWVTELPDGVFIVVIGVRSWRPIVRG